MPFFCVCVIGIDEDDEDEDDEDEDDEDEDDEDEECFEALVSTDWFSCT